MDLAPAILLVSSLVAHTAWPVGSSTPAPSEPGQNRTTGSGGPRVVQVQKGTRLEVENFAGEVVIKPGPRDEVTVSATQGTKAQIDVTSGDKVVRVEARFEGVTRAVDFEITVPAWMEVNVKGNYTDITVEGTKAPVFASNLRGDISVKGGADRLSLKSIEGSILVEGARGRVDASSSSGSVTIRDVMGDIVAETVEEDISIERADGASVEASSVDGSIRLSGPIRDSARYSLTSHDGDITVSVPDGANLTVQARTMGGEFTSNLSVKPTEVRKGRRYRLSIGTGSAQMELESFDGDIRLRRPGTEKAEMRGAEKDEASK